MQQLEFKRWISWDDTNKGGKGMTGKTHLAVGTAATLFITQPRTIKELVLALGASMIGSIICDIDVSTSKSRKELNRILGLIIFILVIGIFVEYNWNIGIYNMIKRDTNIFRIIMGIFALGGVCIYGKDRPHRSFMHSILGVFSIGICTYIILPDTVLYIVIAMMSHIVIDLFNKKKVLLFYPLKKGISFDLCKSDGIVNGILFKMFSLLLMIEVIYVLHIIIC